MFDNPPAFAVYLALKYAAYSVWMYIGIRLLSDRGGALRALGLGLLRLGMGLVFGVGIFIASMMAASAASHAGLAPEVVAYLGVYVPVRWIEWAIMEMLLRPSGAQSLPHFVLGVDARGRKWRLGGILISCLADLVVFADLGGLPLGRFLC